MNIINILEQNHEKLRKELVQIKNCLSTGHLREEVKNFVSLYEAHECIEEEILFPSLRTYLAEREEDESLLNLEEWHTSIWAHLDELVDGLTGQQFLKIQTHFFKFCALVESHFRYEEQILFPKIEEIMDSKVLEDLGDKLNKTPSQVLTGSISSPEINIKGETS